MKTIDELKEKLSKITDIAVEIYNLLEDQENHEPESWGVKTPVDFTGDILFSENKQSLGIKHGLYRVSVMNGDRFSDCRSSWKWVKTTRDELKPGDTAYRSNNPGGECRFDSTNLACKVLDDALVVYVNGGYEIRRCADKYLHWFKLVRRQG